MLFWKNDFNFAAQLKLQDPSKFQVAVAPVAAERKNENEETNGGGEEQREDGEDEEDDMIFGLFDWVVCYH